MIVKSEADLVRWQHQWANYHVLLTMVQLGFFDLLSDGQARTAESIAHALNADERAIDICGRILVRTGLLRYEDGKFRATQTARDLREPLDELKWEWRRRQNFTDLLDTIRSGQPAMVTSGGVVEADEDDTREFLKILYRRSADGVREAVRMVRQVLAEIGIDRPPRILDVGGGHGRYSAAFAAELGALVTLFDRPLVTKIAHELSGTGFATESGDFLRDDLGGPYDLVFLSYIVSGIALDDVGDLLGRIRRVTVAEGAVVVMDMFVEPSGIDPDAAIDFNLILLLENRRGRFRSVAELTALLAENGFPHHEHYRVQGQEFGFVVGRGSGERG